MYLTQNQFFIRVCTFQWPTIFDFISKCLIVFLFLFLEVGQNLLIVPSLVVPNRLRSDVQKCTKQEKTEIIGAQMHEHIKIWDAMFGSTLGKLTPTPLAVNYSYRSPAMGKTLYYIKLIYLALFHYLQFRRDTGVFIWLISAIVPDFAFNILRSMS